MDWEDLSDSELRSRLVNRGVPVDIAYSLVQRRETASGRENISKILER